MNNITELKEWQDLVQHQLDMTQHHMRDWFANDLQRFSRFSLQQGDIFFDYSRNRITEHTLKLLCDLATAVHLPKKIHALFSGHPVNTTENRAALHTALRDMAHTPIQVNGENIDNLVSDARKMMYDFVNKIHSHAWRGITGKPITDIVNVGIGGSCLGPMMTTQALKNYALTDLHFHFISSVDKDQLNDVLALINPETTLFIISSKSFSTLETITNAKTIMRWMKDKLGTEALTPHFVAVTAAHDKAIALGIAPHHIFPVWDWVGGRYSIWSAIGLPLALMIGEKNFDAFLTGAHEMDVHFKEAPLDKNIPVLLALISIWYMNFFHANVQAVVPYSHRLRSLIPYLQQAEMESNGKATTLKGKQIHYATGPVIFGDDGCNSQHAFFQLLHQGRHFIPVDFILLGQDTDDTLNHHHDILFASALSQAQALMFGKTLDEAQHELVASAKQHTDSLAHHQVIPGNRPSNILMLRTLSPKTLGALLALYEHKIFVQGTIWDINSFDQWGVELGKALLPNILNQVQGLENGIKPDAATANLIHHFKKMQDAT